MVLLGPDWEKAKTQAEVGRFSDRFKGSNILSAVFGLSI